MLVFYFFFLGDFIYYLSSVIFCNSNNEHPRNEENDFYLAIYFKQNIQPISDNT